MHGPVLLSMVLFDKQTEVAALTTNLKLSNSPLPRTEVDSRLATLLIRQKLRLIVALQLLDYKLYKLKVTSSPVAASSSDRQHRTTFKTFGGMTLTSVVIFLIYLHNVV